SYFFFFSSRRRHTRFSRDWSSDVCSSDYHAAARLRARAARQEDRRRVGHLAQALVAHREHAQLVDRAEAVLECAQHPEAAARLAFEVQYRVDHVLEHARAGDAALRSEEHTS